MTWADRCSPRQGRQRKQKQPFVISVGTAHAYTAAVVGLPADRSPGLPRALLEADTHYVLLDGTLAKCDRVGASRADHSHKRRRHGVTCRW